MPSAGTRLGPYEIVAPIGAGGMGEVYRATDTRLQRTVAIKVVSERLRGRPDLRERFGIEAKAIAAINHTHICQLYDVGRHDDIDFLVMEYVEGETLSSRLGRGRLPVERALTAARDIAAALDAAHRHGIVHRDLKPANIMLTRTGVKLLDFGVARLRAPAPPPAAPDATGAPIDAKLTDTGAALGTWRYMAPEQIRGLDADGRSDLFAFGAVVYEMLAGRAAFDARDHHALVTAILESEPAPLGISVPPAFEQIVRTCLAKQPDDRWQSAGDLHRTLTTLTMHEPQPMRSAWRTDRRLRWAALAIAALVSVGLVAGLRLRATPPEVIRTVRSTLPLGPERVGLATGGAIAFSPDGTSVVYEGATAGGSQLFRRVLADTTAATVVGTENATNPFFSPDGTWIGFYRLNQLMKVPINGGRPIAIADLESFAGASWGNDGVILVGTRHETGLFKVSAAGGPLEPFTVPSAEDRDNDHRFPQLLPGGRAVLFTIGTGPEDTARIMVMDVRSGDRKELFRGTAAAKYVATGHLVYARNGELFAVPFDLERLELAGAHIRIADGVAEGTDGWPEYSLSAAGDLVYVPGGFGGPRRALTFVDMHGGAEKAALPTGYYDSPRVSPDGRYIALFVGGAKNNAWVYDVTRETSTRVTFGRYHFPIWRPDGRLTVAQGPPGRLRLVQRAADPAGTDEELTPREARQFPESWTPDGRSLIYERFNDEGHWDLWAVSPGGRPPHPIVASRFNERNARVSPDGRWLAYTSDENGRPQTYVRGVEREGARLQISVDGSTACAWAPDGRRLFYRGINETGQPADMWAVDIDADPTLRASRPKRLFTDSLYQADFDVTTDGKRFVMVQRDSIPPPGQLHLVLNWFAASAASPTR